MHQCESLEVACRLPMFWLQVNLSYIQWGKNKPVVTFCCVDLTFTQVCLPIISPSLQSSHCSINRAWIWCFKCMWFRVSLPPYCSLRSCVMLLLNQPSWKKKYGDGIALGFGSNWRNDHLATVIIMGIWDWLCHHPLWVLPFLLILLSTSAPICPP